MTYSNSLSDDRSPLVLDTSVIINLSASGNGSRILSALPNDILVPGIVVSELDHETSKANGEYQFIKNQLASRTVKLVDLNEQEYAVFENLVTSLDDGEAATISAAVCRGCVAVLDDRKGRMIAKAYFPSVLPVWSFDLFRHPRVVSELGEALSAEALYLALRDGRMRIHEDCCDLVVNLIGVHHALDCKSLPGYKVRRRQWQQFTT